MKIRGHRLTELESLIEQAGAHLAISRVHLEGLNELAEEHGHTVEAVRRIEDAAHDIALTSSELLTAIVAAYEIERRQA